MYYLNGFYDDTDGGFVPEGAVKISEDLYRTLLNGQSAGKQIIADSASTPILIEPQPSAAHEWNGKEWTITNEKQAALLAETQAHLIANIDEHAAKIYGTWTRFESEYRERQAAAEAYKSASYEGECSRYITDFAQRAGLDNKTATNLILTQAAGLEKLQVELANQRMRKYELKAPGLTLEQMQATYDDIIKQMNNLMEAYNNG
jgi:hypothetical protein